MQAESAIKSQRKIEVVSHYEWIPSGTGTRFILPALCAAGGLITGVIHHFAGNYPDELNVVLYKVKKEKYYDYRHLAAMLGCAFLPLVFGSSVGPEAGLTGIIAALCYWVGDNVTFARNYSALYSAVGEAVTLGEARDIHHLHISEVSCTEFLANRPGFEISDIEFSEVFTNSNVSLLEVADFCLVGTLFFLETKADLDSSVAVLLFCLMANDHARTGFENRDRDAFALFREHLGHSQFLCENTVHCY